MNSLNAVLGIVCALVLAGLGPAGTASAAGYDDFQAGDWNNASTWTPNTDYPQSADDTALIDSVMVTVPGGFTFPAIASVTLGGTGELFFNETTTTAGATTLYLTGGGAFNKSRYRAVEWAGAIVVSGGVTTMETGRDQMLTLSGNISSTTSNCTIARVVDDWYGSTVLTADNSGYSGTWDVRAGNLWPRNNLALGTGTVNVGGSGGTRAQVIFRGAETWSGIAGPQAVIMNTGGYLQYDELSGGADIDFTNDTLFIFDGGKVVQRAGTLRDPVLVKDGGMTDEPRSCYHDYYGNISSESDSGVITISAGSGNVRFYGDNSGFTGEIVVENASGWGNGLQTHSAKALGNTGTVTVKSGCLYPVVPPDPLLPPPTVIVQSGGCYGGEGAMADTDWNITLDGGAFYSKNTSLDHSGNLAITANGGTIQSVYGDLTFSGAVSGTGKLTCDLGNQGAKQIFTNAGNYATFSGGMDIQNCANDVVQVTADGALGSGTVNILGGGRLETAPAGGTGNAAISNVPVVVQSGGALRLNSAETAADVTLLFGGLIQDLSDTTVFDFDNNFHVHTGAIFQYNEVADDLPAIAQIIPDAAAERYVYKGDSGTYAAGDYTVGTGTVVRGLAGIGNTTMNSGVKMHEATPGGGFDLFAPAGTQMDLRGLELDATGPLKLVGNGTFQFSRYNDPAGPFFTGTVTTINKYGDGGIKCNNTGVLNGDHTLNVHEGFLDFGRYSSSYSDALGTTTNPDDWAAVNIKDGALFYSEYTGGIQLSRGKITIESGGAAFDREGFDDGAQWTFQPSSQIMVAGNITTGSVVGTGNPTYIFWEDRDYKLGDSAGGVDVVLSDNNRITLNVNRTRGLTADSGDLVLAAKGGEGLVTARNDGRLVIRNKVNMPAGTLVIGAAGTFNVHTGWRYNTPYTQRADITQAGQVQLTNTGNDVGLIDVRYGQLYLQGTGIIDDTDVHVSATSNGVNWYGDMDVTDTRFSGTGTLQATGWGHIRGGTLNPGEEGSAGILTVTCGGWYMHQGGAANNVQLVADVVNDGAKGTLTAGTDYDKITGVRLLDDTSPGNADLTINMPLPSGQFVPANFAGATLEVYSHNEGNNDVDLTLHPFNSAVLNTVGDPNNHWTGTITYERRSVTVSDLVWTGFGGDADVNGVVNYLDLGVLATNYDLTGLGWGDGDFNFDGKVDYMDLGILATNYDLTEGGGGANIPEPAALVVLALGAAGLIRRRRR